MTTAAWIFTLAAAAATLGTTLALLWPLAQASSRAGRPRRTGITDPRSMRLLALMSVGLPLLATSLYLHLGAPRLLLMEPGEVAHRLNPQDMAAATAGLAQRLTDKPQDLEGWFVLARSYQTMERWDDAAKAYRRALLIAPDEPQILADLADVLATSQGGNLEGEPRALIQRALQQDPDHAKSLALAAMAAYRRRQLDEALAHWERLAALHPTGSDIAGLARDGISRVRAEQRRPTPATGHEQPPASR